MILDGIEKPGNIGAILRTSLASNVDTIIITNKKCDTHNPNVIRSSVGSFFKTKIIYLENNEALKFLKKNKFKIYAASLNSDKIYSNENYNFPIGLVFGSENEGISKFWEENSDEISLNKKKLNFNSNNAGGILGGISSGQEIIVSFAVKPTSSILKSRRTINKFGKNTTISVKGRHDPCVGIRAVPVGEAMLSCVLLDHYLMNKAQCD